MWNCIEGISTRKGAWGFSSTTLVAFFHETAIISLLKIIWNAPNAVRERSPSIYIKKKEMQILCTVRIRVSEGLVSWPDRMVNHDKKCAADFGDERDSLTVISHGGVPCRVKISSYSWAEFLSNNFRHYCQVHEISSDSSSVV